MGFQWMCFPNSQIEINIRFFVLLLREMQHNSLKSKKKSMKIKEKFQIFDINLRLYILHNIQWFKHEPTSGHWFLVGRFYRVRTMIVTLKIVPKKLGSMVFQWHGHYVCQCLMKSEYYHLWEVPSYPRLSCRCRRPRSLPRCWWRRPNPWPRGRVSRPERSRAGWLCLAWAD